MGNSNLIINKKIIMAQFTETRQPYEFLIRWNNEGQIQGAHIAFLDTVLKDGEIVTQTQSSVESVAVAEQMGFPLADVLSQIQIDVLKKVDTLNLEKSNLESEKSSLNTDIETHFKTIENLQAEAATYHQAIQNLQAQLAALQPKEDEAKGR